MSSSFDLAVRKGTLVTSSGRSVADVGVRGGKIAQIGGSMSADLNIDASGCFVLPGGVDMHVHLSPVEFGERVVRWADDFESGSRAAAAGGVTTIGNMTFPRTGEALRSAIERTRADAEASSVVDFVLHPVVLEPSEAVLAEIPDLARGGHTTIKIFMSIGDFDGQSHAFLDAMRVAGRCGVLTMLHCEDGCIISHLARELVAAGKGDLSHYSESRPVFSETAAVVRAIAFAEAADAPIYIVHLGSADALTEAHRAHARGLRVYVETRPVYLYFTSERLARPDGALYVGSPPLRDQRDVDALWSGLAAADIHTCCTDHAAWTRDEKTAPDLNVANTRPGMSDLETLMPLLWAHGVTQDRLSIERFVDITATNAAKLFGLYPQKGTIAVGSDADIVVWDPELTRRIDGASAQSRAGYSLYDGWETTGWPVATLSRGELIYDGRDVVAAGGRGRLVPRELTRAL